MKFLCITHADFEGPGIIQSWADEKSIPLEICRPFQNETLPPIENYEIIFVLGGPQSAMKIEEYPYLQTEIDYIRDAIQQDKKVMGFCLGAQLIGEALGAPTEESPEPEIGQFPITLTEDALNDPLMEGFPQTFEVTHWHKDMPGLISGAALLAYSVGCPRQIIRYQPKVYGFQCHLEFTQDGIKDLLDSIPKDIQPSQYVQTKETLLEHHYQPINDKMIDILDRFILI